MSEAVYQMRPRFDPTDTNVIADPYPTYALLRNAGRVCRGGPGELVIARYADVDRFLQDQRLASQFPPAYYALAAKDGPACAFLQHILLHQDGGRHRVLRKLMARHFSSGAQAKLRKGVIAILESLIARCGESGMLEVVGELARPLPAKVMFMVLGVPEEDYDLLLPKVIVLGRAFTSLLTGADRREVNEAIEFLRGYIRDRLHDRGGASREDLLSDLLILADENRLDEDEIVDNAVFLLFAGFETTSCVLANGWALLLRHPDQLVRLAAEPGLLPQAVEEFIRYDAPIQSRLRMVKEPIEIDGRVIRPGRLLLLLIGSANRDERQFERPDEFDIARTPNRHLSFGGGEHFCLGASLAQLECRLAFGYLVRRFGKFEPAGEFVRRSAGPFRTYDRLPLSVKLPCREHDV